MAAYKVIQDIEAEDKLVGPLTFRQFIYAGIGAICLYLSFLAFTKHAAFLIAFFLPVAGVAGFFAFPWGRDQPTEIWALAKIQFMFKPRRRVWNQSGVRELVSITVPKRVEQHYTNGLSQIEVRSRLTALAGTIDSRGWIIKGPISSYGPSAMLTEPNSDRLLSPSAMPVEVPNYDVQASDDVLDADNNPAARQLDQMITAATQAHRQQIIDNFRHVAPPTPPPATPQRAATPAAPTNNYWFASQPAAAPMQAVAPTMQPATPAYSQQQVVMPGAYPQQPQAIAPAQPQQSAFVQPQASAFGAQPAPAFSSNSAADQNAPVLDEAALMAQLRAQDSADQNYNSHLHTIQPLDAAHQTAHPQAPAQPAQKTPSAPVTHKPDPAILALANNDDLSVATIARQANKELENTDEVVITLH